MEDLTTTTTTEKTATDIIFDFADTLAICLGNEEPDHKRACEVLLLLTQLGQENPTFVRKIFSPQMSAKIAEVAPKFQNGSLGIMDIMSVAGDIKKTFDVA